MGIPSLALQNLRRSRHHPFSFNLRCFLSYFNSPNHVAHPCNNKLLWRDPCFGFGNFTQFEMKPKFRSGLEHKHFIGACSIHVSRQLRNTSECVEPQNSSTGNATVDIDGSAKVKRKKLKGRRAVVKFLKSLRYKKKKEFERMTAEEKILFKLRKARRKEERLVEALKKIEPSESAEPTHDPEILTPEEHFYLLKMGHKCKNYVPVGRRGIFQGVILNMHLHWKKHQTLKVVVKTFTKEEVQEIAAELARLSGGIVLDIHEENTIIMYRGKNYSQPPTEIMSPKVALPRKKALDKSKYRDALRAVRRFIPKLQQELENLPVQMRAKPENKIRVLTEDGNETVSDRLVDHRDEFEEAEIAKYGHDGNESPESSGTLSESGDLSDLFETDSDGEMEQGPKEPLYLNTLGKFSSQDDRKEVDFEKHLRGISAASKRGDPLDNDVEVTDLDEIDKMFLRADSLLNKKKR